MTPATSDSGIIRLATASGLLIEASSAKTRVLDDFYKGYDAAFVLPNEKEGYAGFAECLELNAGEAYTRLSQRYGTFREFVVVARAPETGAQIGGANFIAYPLRAACSEDDAILSINLSYIYIDAEARRRGYFRRLVNELPGLAFQLLTATSADVPCGWMTADAQAGKALPKTLMFIEQNDPFRMSEEAYRLDTQHSGLDQLDRIAIWARLGAKIIDFPYVQPPLTSSQQADHSLVLAVLGADSDTLDACLLHDHLQRFFGISVLKGQDVMQISSAAEQLAALQKACRQRRPIPLLDAHSLAKSAGGVRPASLREALRSQP